MEGYKVFESDWTCRGFQFEVGKIYEEDTKPLCCNRGFHFCKELSDCFNHYSFNPNNKVAKVIALGEIDEESSGSKCCTNKIQIVEEIAWEDVLRMVNLGKGNTGNRNSGDYNSGNYNSGNWNKANFSSGCFNTVEPKIYLFNKPSDWTRADWVRSDAKWLLDQIPTNDIVWIYSSEMTDEEKEKYPEYKVTGGYLGISDEDESPQSWWDDLLEDEKNTIKSIPNFDKEIFKEITGIEV